MCPQRGQSSAERSCCIFRSFWQRLMGKYGNVCVLKVCFVSEKPTVFSRKSLWTETIDLHSIDYWSLIRTNQAETSLTCERNKPDSKTARRRRKVPEKTESIVHKQSFQVPAVTSFIRSCSLSAESFMTLSPVEGSVRCFWDRNTTRFCPILLDFFWSASWMFWNQSLENVSVHLEVSHTSDRLRELREQIQSRKLKLKVWIHTHTFKMQCVWHCDELKLH